ncbi:DivIVA domain-containing protein [Saccharopolyspora hordei]|uniref:Cell division septum initiation protein DivIVA n=1 Tax=Saccharopolyspora hordei TaxID=1838 RepID=A0A853AU73_9PSEU|nr:hypothetical protein [Saccharopolyspora hordei]NYI86204.1 cell division septum initiation protein DivIVA [Saccharopolyspora hordei]
MDDADSVVPLRPGFDIQVRGFNRNQVIEHIELLEDQLRLVTIDRNEAAQLNSDLRKLCDDTRRALDAAEERLRRIESSDTGLPAASQRVQNMLSIAEEEVQTLREQARRQAEIIRGTAENEARELIREAEQTANELREECNQLIAEVEERRAQLHREHDQKASELRAKEHRMRQNIRAEYKRVIAAAQEEADALIAQTRKQCGQWDAETEQMRLQALEEINAHQQRLEELHASVLSSMDQAQRMLGASIDELRTHPPATAPVTAEPAPTAEPAAAGEPDPEPEAELPVQLPEQRDDVQTFLIPMDGAHPSTNGATPQPGPAR